MSAIYLIFDRGNSSRDQQEAFQGTIAGRTNAHLAAKIDFHVSNHFCAASAHHGVLPSGGIASSGNAVAVSTGSCWTDPESDSLQTPEELLVQWKDRPWESAPQMAGLFSFGFFAGDKMELVVESDRFGVMPLFYREDEHGIAVASEMKFLLRPGNDQPNTEAIAEMMDMGFLSRHHTAIQGIMRLPANSRLVYDHQGLKIVPHPLPVFSRDRALDRDALDEYDQRVRHYFQRFKGITDKFSVSLSGGLDSRLVAYAAKRAGINFHAFTTGERSSLDTVIAQRVAGSLESPIHFHRIEPREMPEWFARMVWMTEGRVHPGHMHYMSAGFHSAVPSGPLLHGLGLETVLGGHYDNPALQTSGSEEIRRSCIAATTGLNYWPRNARKSVFGEAIGRWTEGTYEAVAEDLFQRIGFTGIYRDFIEYRAQFKGVSWARPCIIGQVLPWSDVVNPFFDHHAYDFGATLSVEGIADRAGQLRWGMEYFPGFADIPRVKSGVVIPVALDTPGAYQKGIDRLMREAKIKFYIGRLTQGRINLPMKNSFPQYWQWYPKYKCIRNYVDGILLSDQTLDRGYLQREGTRSLLHDCRIGRRTWNAVGSLLMVELLLRQFIDGDWNSTMSLPGFSRHFLGYTMPEGGVDEQPTIFPGI